MSKIVLDTIASGYNLAKINDNFTKIAAALNDEVLYRDVPDGETNTVKNNIDMDSNDLLNVGDLRVLGTASIDGINFDAVNSALVWRGVWNSSTSYAVSDAVSYNGSSYIAIIQNTNSIPPSVNWGMLAQQGGSGAGTGDVIGPTSCTSGALSIFGNGTGKLISDSGITPSTLVLKGPLSSSGITGAASDGDNSDITHLNALVAGGIPSSSILTNNIADYQVTPEKLSRPSTLGTAVSTTSGSSIDIVSIPNWVDRITLTMRGCTFTGAHNFLIQPGAGAPQASGYSGVSSYIAATNSVAQHSSSSGHLLTSLGSGIENNSVVVLVRQTENSWLITHTGMSGGYGLLGISTVTLSGVLDRIRITSTGSSTFSSGTINIYYE